MQTLLDKSKEGTWRPLVNGIGITGKLSVSHCWFLYQNLPSTSTDKHHVGCNPNRIFLEHAAAKFNFSVRYPKIKVEFLKQRKELLQTSRALVLFGTVARDRGTKAASEQSMIQVLHDSYYLRLLYCIEYQELESFNFMFWTIPFDKISWIMVGVSAIVLVIYLRGQCMVVVAGMMRQSISRIDWNVAVLTFVFMSVVLVSCYESLIPSVLIIPPYAPLAGGPAFGGSGKNRAGLSIVAPN